MPRDARAGGPAARRAAVAPAPPAPASPRRPFAGRAARRRARRGRRSLLKFYRYRRGHSFGLHVDTSHKGGGPGEETEFTLLVYLNTQGEAVAGEAAGEAAGEEAQQPLVGGDTVFMRTAKAELCRVSPRAGVALLHAHGRRCCMHEAEEVRRGVKWVLRADVLYRRVDAAAPPPEAPLAAGAGAGGGRRRGKGR